MKSHLRKSKASGSTRRLVDRIVSGWYRRPQQRKPHGRLDAAGGARA